MASPSDAASKEDEFFAQRRTVLAFLDFLRTAPLPPSVDSDALEVAADCLSEAFGVSPQNPDDLEKYSVLPGTLLQLIQDSTPGSATGHGSSAGAARPGGQLVENSQAAASLPEPMDEENKRDAEPREADLGDRVGGGSVAAGTENARIGNGDSGGREGGKEVEMKDAVEGATEQTGEQAKERAWETARGEAGAGGSGPNRQGEEGQVEAQGALDLEKKLQEFLQGLESAGYYAGTVVGSEEYVTRQQQARGIFHQCVAQQGGGREGGDKEQGDGGSEQGKEGGEKEGGEKEGGEKEGNEKEEEGGSKSSEGRKEQRGDKGKEKETEMGDASAATASGAAGGAASGAGGAAASGAGGGAASGVTASASAETVGGGGAAAAVVTEEDKKKAEELKAQGALPLPATTHPPTPSCPRPFSFIPPAGNAAMAAHNYDEALSLYSKAIALCGNAAMAAHNYEEALSLYSKAIALCGGTNAIYYANRAAAQHQLGNYMEAAADSRRAVAVDPRYSKAYSRLGHACMALGRHHEAIEEGFKKALELDPSNAAHKENLKDKIDQLCFPLFAQPNLDA
ncbi:unnamed protein product [Closterium sp. NIES-64]|nr:unnamed protein product [Closterium sp. NIES-64]